MATKVEMQARIEELEAQAEAKNGAGTVSFKVSQKGGVSLYGLGRWPVTLYQSQWERLLESESELREFMRANASKLAVKGSN